MVKPLEFRGSGCMMTSVLQQESFMKTVIVIPARYQSTRLPGKPLAMISGQTMLQRVVRIAEAVAKDSKNVSVLAATDDERIAQHCDEIGVKFVMTDPDLPSGTDRVAAAVQQLSDRPDFVLNLQGDAPLTPPDFLRTMIESFSRSPCDVITPVTQLSWPELDKLRLEKTLTPLSGTTAVFDPVTGRAMWFSKNIIPAMRGEQKIRAQVEMSPVYRHIGLYGYSAAALEKFIHLPVSRYEILEGLEQLRMLENGFEIRCVPVNYNGRANMSGIDSQEDIARAEALIAKHGELLSS